MKQLYAILVCVFAAVSASAQAISPVFFGQNYWLSVGAENRVGYLHLLWPQVEASGVKLIRIGGNAYNVDPPSRAKWSAMVDSVQAIGAEPLVQVPYTFTAEEASEFVSYFTAPGRQPVRYWSIGNEPMLHDEHTLEEVYAYLQRLAPAMREAAPSMKLLISDEAWLREPVYAALCGGDMDMTGKDAKGRWLIDGFTFHSYPNGAEYERADVVGKSVAAIRRDTQTLVALLEKADALHGRVGAERLVWGLTEVNVTYANPDRDVEGVGNPSFLGGQFMAEVFGIGMEFGALTVAPWAINETDNVTTDFGYLGLPPDFAPRSSYYHTQMMAEHFEGNFLKTFSPDPLLKIIGARSGKRIAILLLNEDQRADRSLSLALSLDDSALSADAGLAKSLEIVVPSQASRLYVLSAKGKLIETITYGIQQNLRNLPPVTERF